MTLQQRIVIAGGSGFVGSVLREHFTRSGFDVVILSRRREHSIPGGRTRHWDAVQLGPWIQELEGARAVINLAGQSVDCRYHLRNRRRILESRVQPTRLIGEAIRECRQPPPLWLNASTATLYRHTLGPAWDESGLCDATPEANDAFSVEVAKAWEAAVDASVTPRTRKVKLRMAMVLGLGANSVFPTLRRLVRCGLGGRMGDGCQYVSWIHQDDLCRSIDFLSDHPELDGAVNVAAPHPLPNADMMAEIRKAIGMPLFVSHSKWMLEAGAWCLRTETELILKSRRVVPRKLLEAGFQFRFNRFPEAVADLLQQGRT